MAVGAAAGRAGAREGWRENAAQALALLLLNDIRRDEGRPEIVWAPSPSEAYDAASVDGGDEAGDRGSSVPFGLAQAGRASG